MASSTKSSPEKKTEENNIKKKSTKAQTLTLLPTSVAKRKSDKHNASNGDSRAPPSSDPKREPENGVEAAKSASKAKKPKPKPKRERGDHDDGDAAGNRFPMERVKRIIRSEDSDVRISNEALFLVNKATERFLEKLSEEARECCVQDRKKSLSYKHLSLAVSKSKRYDFLSDFVPLKVKVKDALAEIKSMEPEAA